MAMLIYPFETSTVVSIVQSHCGLVYLCFSFNGLLCFPSEALGLHLTGTMNRRMTVSVLSFLRISWM
jgi:hypothetical protein